MAIRSDYPPGVSLRPLVGWVGAMTPQQKRRRSAFDSSFSDTMTLLERELRMYDQRDSKYPVTVLQIAISDGDLRKDGLPRAHATPKHPGIILSVEPKNKRRITLPCDTFLHWHDNVRAVALTLEALRKIERYGVAQNDEQYRGWQALPAGASAIVVDPFPTPEAAFEHISTVIGLAFDGRRPNADAVSTMYRAALGRTHPDRNNGERSEWNKVEQAGQVLKASGWL